MTHGRHFGLTEANALVNGAAGHDENAAQLAGDVRSLIGEMEADAAAMAGDQLAEFRKAKALFVEAFEALAVKCGLQGMELAEIHAVGGNTDAEIGDDYAQVGAGIRPINAASPPDLHSGRA